MNIRTSGGVRGCDWRGDGTSASKFCTLPAGITNRA
jgi:hypothetical protein